MKNIKICFLKITEILMTVPTDLLIAFGITRTVEGARNGDLRAVALSGLLVVGGVIIFRSLETLLSQKYIQSRMLSVQGRKLEVYELQIGKKLTEVGKATAGDKKEQFDDDINTVTKYELECIPSAIAYACIAVGYTFILLTYGWNVLFVVLAMAMLKIIPPVIVKKWLEKSYTECRDIESEITNEYLAGIEGFRTLKAYGATGWFESRMHKLNTDYLSIGNRSILCAEAEGVLNQLIGSILKYGLYIVCGIMLLNRMIDIDGMIAVIVLSSDFFAAVSSVFSLISDKAEYRAANSRIYEKGDRVPITTDVKEINMDNISLELDEGILIESANASFGNGKKILIKGENGAGKSTVLQLAVGLKKPTGGKVRFSGAKDYYSTDVNLCFTEEIVYLPQEDLQLSISFNELTEMADAEKRAGMFEYARRFGMKDEDLYDKKISEMSGGERKKAFLAYVFGMESKIAFVDEPENSLDKQSIEEVAKAFDEYKNAWTVVSHGQSLDTFANETLYIEKRALIHE